MGLDVLLEFGVNIVLGILSRVIKNPGSVKIERSVIQHIADFSSQALAAMDSTATTTVGYGTPPTAAPVPVATAPAPTVTLETA